MRRGSGFWRLGSIAGLLAVALACSSATGEAQAPSVAPARKEAVDKMMKAVQQPSTDRGREQAVRLLEEAVSQDAQLWEAHYNLGVLLARQGDLSSALEQLKLAHELAPNAEDVVVALSEVYRRRDDESGAVAVLTRFVSDYPEALTARRSLIVALRESGRSEDALEHALGLLERRPGDPAALAELALTHLARDRVDVAELLVQEALQARSDSAVVRRAAGLIALERGEDALAFTHFAKATELDPEDTAAGLNTATVLLEAGVFDQAERHFRRVLDAEPDSEPARLGLAAALRGQGSRDRQGPYRAAEKVLRELVEASPSHWAASHNLAVLYAESLDRPDEATPLFERFLSLAPSDHPARDRARRWVEEHPSKLAPRVTSDVSSAPAAE